MKRSLFFLLIAAVLCVPSSSAFAKKPKIPLKRKMAIKKGLEYLKKTQAADGHWEASGQYKIPMTALAGMALLCEGSTTSSGRYSRSIQKAVNYLMQNTQTNGLIGIQNSNRYTYGHGFSMLFLSQVYGEEEVPARRKRLHQVLVKSVKFTLEAQTTKGGWGYVSAKDGSDFDEGSTCITQVQGLRACRNAGIPVPLSVIARAIKYIDGCRIKSGPEKGGIIYKYENGNPTGGARPSIAAAACATMFSTGEYKGKMIESMLGYCEKNVWPGGNKNVGGHPHYAHYYYSQVVYRLGEKKWQKYMADIGRTILSQQAGDGSWKGSGWSGVGPVYMTALNLTILQLDKALIPIYQR